MFANVNNFPPLWLKIFRCEAPRNLCGFTVYIHINNTAGGGRGGDLLLSHLHSRCSARQSLVSKPKISKLEFTSCKTVSRRFFLLLFWLKLELNSKQFWNINKVIHSEINKWKHIKRSCGHHSQQLLWILSFFLIQHCPAYSKCVVVSWVVLSFHPMCCRAWTLHIEPWSSWWVLSRLTSPLSRLSSLQNKRHKQQALWYISVFEFLWFIIQLPSNMFQLGSDFCWGLTAAVANRQLNIYILLSSSKQTPFLRVSSVSCEIVLFMRLFTQRSQYFRAEWMQILSRSWPGSGVKWWQNAYA